MVIVLTPLRVRLLQRMRSLSTPPALVLPPRFTTTLAAFKVKLLATPSVPTVASGPGDRSPALTVTLPLFVPLPMMVAPRGTVTLPKTALGALRLMTCPEARVYALEVTSRTPGLLTVMLVERSALPVARTSLPALIIVGPVKVLAAKSTRLLLPYFASAPAPEMTLVICTVMILVKFNVPSRFTSEPMRKVG